MILLDTNAILWLLTDSPRSQPLHSTPDLWISPVSLLELQYLSEVGRLQLSDKDSLRSLPQHPFWNLDNPPSEQLFHHALELSWTRDPFDRLLVAHANYRQWKLATGDRLLLAELPEHRLMEL